jgi:putative phosphoribosyl transferase
MLFRDRQDAGRQLGVRLAGHRGDDVVVLGLPRGGVPVAAEVARALGAPLDVLVVRKLGAPGMPEYGVGAIAEGRVVHLSSEAVKALRLDRDPGAGLLAQVVDREEAELARRVRVYRGGRKAPDLTGRRAIIVDDGIATGGTAMAAVKAARALGAEWVGVAAPVVAPDTLVALRRLADEVVCLDAPDDFQAVGQWYLEFPQTSDAEVLACLQEVQAGSCGPVRER